MKKIISIALALLMVAVMLPVMAMADESTAVAKLTIAGKETLHDSLVDAVKAAINKTDAKIDVLKSSSGDGIVVFFEKGEKLDLTIDFHGHTYDVSGKAVGSKGYVSQAWHIEKESKLTLMNGTLEATSPHVAMLFQNYSDLTLDNMVLNAQKTGFDYTMSNNNGSLTVKGNSKIIAADGKCAFDVYYWPDNGYTDGIKVTFDESFTGEVVGNIEYGTDKSKGSADWADKAILTIKGNGTFTGNFRTYNLTTDAAKANITITGGKFEDREGAANYIPSNMEIDEYGNVVNKPGTPIIIYNPTEDTPKANDQKNPGTGANDFVGVAAAMAVVSLLGAAAVIRKK